MRRKLAVLIRLEFKMQWSVHPSDFKRVSANREHLTNSEQVDFTFTSTNCFWLFVHGHNEKKDLQ